MKNKSMKTDITDLPLPRDPAAEEREAQAALLSNVPKKPTYLDLVKAIQAVDEIVSQPQPGLPPLPPLWADVILRLTRPQVYRLVQHAMHEEQVDAYAEHKLRNPR